MQSRARALFTFGETPRRDPGEKDIQFLLEAGKSAHTWMKTQKAPSPPPPPPMPSSFEQGLYCSGSFNGVLQQKIKKDYIFVVKALNNFQNIRIHCKQGPTVSQKKGGRRALYCDTASCVKKLTRSIPNATSLVAVAWNQQGCKSWLVQFQMQPNRKMLTAGAKQESFEIGASDKEGSRK